VKERLQKEIPLDRRQVLRLVGIVATASFLSACDGFTDGGSIDLRTNNPFAYLQQVGNHVLSLRERLAQNSDSDILTPIATKEGGTTTTTIIKKTPGLQETVTINFAPRMGSNPLVITQMKIETVSFGVNPTDANDTADVYSRHTYSLITRIKDNQTVVDLSLTQDITSGSKVIINSYNYSTAPVSYPTKELTRTSLVLFNDRAQDVIADFKK